MNKRDEETWLNVIVWYYNWFWAVFAIGCMYRGCACMISRLCVLWWWIIPRHWVCIPWLRVCTIIVYRCSVNKWVRVVAVIVCWDGVSECASWLFIRLCEWCICHSVNAVIVCDCVSCDDVLGCDLVCICVELANIGYWTSISNGIKWWWKVFALPN